MWCGPSCGPPLSRPFPRQVGVSVTVWGRLLVQSPVVGNTSDPLMATMFSKPDLAKVLSLIEGASVAGRTTLVAIDGLGGAGKSTLAEQLRKAIELSVIVRGDDFYTPVSVTERTKLGPEDGYNHYFDWQRLRDDVLEPLAKELRAQYRRHDWETDRLAESHVVEPGGVVILEGVYSTRPQLRPYLGVTVYIDTPREQRLARMLSRRYEDLSWVERWMGAEDWYEEHERPKKHVDLVLRGT